MESIDRSIEWSNIAHPIGQLLGYMVEFRHCYGALTSGTKTYFLKIQCPEGISLNIDPDGHMPKGDEVPVYHNNAYHMTTRSFSNKRKTNTAAISSGAHNDTTNMGSKVARVAKNLFCTSKTGSKRTSRTKKDASSDKAANENEPAEHFDCYIENSGVKVYISDAWCVGEENYLRAWVHMHTLHEISTGPWKEPTDWIKSTPKSPTPTTGRWRRKQAPSKFPGRNKRGQSKSPKDVRGASTDYRGNSANCCNLDYYYPIHQGVLEHVPINDIVFLGILGVGRNGACFKVQWNGIECALKQFDIGRDGDTYFEKEIQAYMLLQKAWGILAPRPLFLSESFSGGRLFLGLQLGRKSNGSDDDLLKFKNVLQQLETEYGILHNDAVCGRNMIVITDANGVERVAAIDFESWVEV